MEKVRILILVGISIFILNACSKPGTEITEKEYGEKWPFTVASGRLECKGQAVIFHTGGKSYAVNGVAKQKAYTAIDPIWKEDPRMKKMFGDQVDFIPKVSIGPIIDAGLLLCK